MKITEVKKKNGTIVYRASIYLGIDSVTGKKIKTSITARTKKEVKQKVQHAQLSFQTSGSTVYKEVQIKNYQELANLWLKSYQLTVRPQTYQNTIQLLNKHILPVFGNMAIDKITPSYIQEFVNKLSKKIVNFKVPHSINRRILQHGVTLRLLIYNPARDIILPKKGKEGRVSIKFIAKEDLKSFLNYMERLSHKKYGHYYDYIFYNFLLSTGCRFGEASALEWSDIDFEDHTIDITKNYSRIVDKVGEPKSKAGIRKISIDNKLINLLKLYQNRQRQLFLSIGASPPLVVFAVPTRIHAILPIRQEALDSRCREINIPRFTFHAFRHTHASLLLNAGISYKELQYRLGHANITMTLDIYAHLSKEKEKEAVSYFEKALENL